MRNFKERLSDIRAFVFDVDGVFTDGTLLLAPGGELLRAMNIRDGYAVKYAAGRGYPIGVISGGREETVRRRFAGLGVGDVYLGADDKLSPLADFCARRGVDPSAVLYMGDDIPDVAPMRACGIRACPADAVPEVKAAAHYVSALAGGRGCVRDVIEQTLRAQGAWAAE